MNGHGNNPGILDVALRELADEFEATPILANVWSFSAESFSKVRRSAPGGAIHADEYETVAHPGAGLPGGHVQSALRRVLPLPIPLPRQG